MPVDRRRRARPAFPAGLPSRPDESEYRTQDQSLSLPVCQRTYVRAVVPLGEQHLPNQPERHDPGGGTVGGGTPIPRTCRARRQPVPAFWRFAGNGTSDLLPDLARATTQIGVAAFRSRVVHDWKRRRRHSRTPLRGSGRPCAGTAVAPERGMPGVGRNRRAREIAAARRRRHRWRRGVSSVPAATGGTAGR